MGQCSIVGPSLDGPVFNSWPITRWASVKIIQIDCANIVFLALQSIQVGPSLDGPVFNSWPITRWANGYSEELEYGLVVSMSNSTHAFSDGGPRCFFPRVTSFPFAATRHWALPWPPHEQMVWPKVFPGVYLRLPQTYVLVHLLVVVAVKVFGPEGANGLLGLATRAPQHGALVEDAHHVPARLLVHENIIATFLPG